MNAPEKTTGASPIVFSIFTRTAFPGMFGMRIIRTVLPLMAGVVARALCAVAHAEYQPGSPLFGPVAQPLSAATIAITAVRVIFMRPPGRTCWRLHYHLSTDGGMK